MSLTVQLCQSQSPVEKIGKTLTVGNSYTCLLKDNTSILKPVIDIRTTDTITAYNYMYIADFGRYYFIDNIESVNNGLWRVSGHVDVLETYKADILATGAVIKRQRDLYNLYLNDPDFMTYNYDKLQTLKFKGGSGFNKALNYILVVNGS